jgi:hypothetical protein
MLPADNPKHIILLPFMLYMSHAEPTGLP